MAAQLTAQFVLKLEDKMSAGVAALTTKLEGLAKLAGKLSLSGLSGAPATLNAVGQAAASAGSKFQMLGIQAQAAGAGLQGLAAGTVTVNGVAQAAGGAASQVGQVATQAQAAAAAVSRIGGGSGGPGVFARLRTGASAFRAELAGTVRHARNLAGELRHMGHSLLTAGATGFGLNHVIGEYAKYENTLRHIAITANTSRADIPRVVGELTRQYNGLALGTGQSSEKIAESANFLITTGIGRQAVDTLLPSVAKASTAYNTNIGDSVQALFSLKENLHVADGDIPGTVSALAVAGKEGHFSFADFSRFLPEIAPLAAGAGLRGAVGTRDLAAMLETSRRNAGTSGEAATNLRDFLSHLFGDGKRGLGAAFGTKGVNLNKLLLDAEKKGISAPEAVLEQVRRMTEGKTSIEKNLIIGSLFHNQQSAQFVRGALADLEYLQHLRAKLREADNQTIENDFLKAADAPEVKLRLLQERLQQLVRRFGEGFASNLGPVNAALQFSLDALDKLDRWTGKRAAGGDGRRDRGGYEDTQGGVNSVLGYLGGFIGLSAALGLLVPVLRLVRTGALLLISPFARIAGGALRAGWALRWVIIAFEAIATAAGAIAAVIATPVGLVLAAFALLGGAAYIVWQQWDKIVPELGKIWDGLGKLFMGYITGDSTKMVEGLTEVLSGLGGVFRALAEGIGNAATAFASWVDGLTNNRLSAAITSIGNQMDELKKTAWGRALRFSLGLGLEGDPAAKEPAGPPAPPAVRNPSTVTDDWRNNVAPMAWHPGTAAAPDPMKLNISIKVDQDGRVGAVTPSTDGARGRVQVDRGQMTERI